MMNAIDSEKFDFSPGTVLRKIDKYMYKHTSIVDMIIFYKKI